MNSRLVASAFGPFALLALTNYSCAPAPDGSPTLKSTGGTGQGTTGGMSGVGSSTGGTPGTTTGGTPAGTTTGGTPTGTATGGTPAGTTGGTPGTTTGGTPTGTTTGGSGSGGISTGGTGPSGGGEATSTGGLVGTSTGGSGTEELTIAALFPDGPDGSLDGMLSLAPCKEKNTAGTDCAAMAYYKGKSSECTGTTLDIKKTFSVGGTPGAMYKATLHFYGVAEPKNYGGDVMREAMGRPGNSADGKGATPTPWASARGGHTYPASDYNTYEIRVSDNTGKETNVYYLNADTSEGHWIYVINYEKVIPVIGGGKVVYRTFDRNCRQIKNCGVNAPNNQCSTEATKRVIDVSKAVPAPTNAAAAQGGLLQPQLTSDGDAGNAGQWLLIDVTAVSAM